MKTVSMAKFRKAQRAVFETRPYWHVFPAIMAKAASWAGDVDHPLVWTRPEKKADVMVVGSEKGLAGSFNSNLFLKAQAFIQEKSRTTRLSFVLVGKKAVNFFKKENLDVDRVYPEKIDKLSRDEIKDLADHFIRLYAFSKTDAVYVVYNEFKSILAPRITIAKILPVDLPPPEGGAAGVSPDWEPEALPLLSSLLPLYVESQVHHALFESQAAEHAARMMAMDNATKNAEDLIADLVLLLNKIRQASITKELLEIMTAVEALAK
jgi:F-type H+-transporting ATPase subunit gamma